MINIEELIEKEKQFLKRTHQTRDEALRFMFGYLQALEDIGVIENLEKLVLFNNFRDNWEE